MSDIPATQMLKEVEIYIAHVVDEALKHWGEDNDRLIGIDLHRATTQRIYDQIIEQELPYEHEGKEYRVKAADVQVSEDGQYLNIKLRLISKIYHIKFEIKDGEVLSLSPGDESK